MGMKKSGPNDASHIVCTIGEFFYISFMFFYIITNIRKKGFGPGETQVALGVSGCL